LGQPFQLGRSLESLAIKAGIELPQMKKVATMLSPLFGIENGMPATAIANSNRDLLPHEIKDYGGSFPKSLLRFPGYSRSIEG
jgi:hypothetical protein